MGGNYNQWTGSPTNTIAGKVSAVNSDDGVTSYIVSGVNNYAQTFTVSGAGLPVGSTINSVTLYAIAKGTQGNPSYALRVEKGTESGNQSDGAVITPNTTYVTSSRVMTTNPFTGAAWTLGEVNSWTTKFGVMRTDASHFVHVTQLWVVVSYNEATPATDGLIVTKNTVGGNGTFNFTGAASFDITTVAGTGNKSISGLTAGAYTVTETVPSGWTKTSDTCSGVVVSAGATTTCAVTNTKKGRIIIDKVTNPSGDAQSFSFTSTGAGYGNFNLTDLATPNNQEVVPGEYSISEDALAGWDLTGVTCLDPTDNSTTNIENKSAAIRVAAGETVTCTFTNTKRGSVTVIKNVVSPNGETDVSDNHSFKAALDGGGSQTFSENSSVIFSNLIPKTYILTEIIGDPDFDLLRIAGDNDEMASNGAPVVVTAGQNTNVTITNKQKKASLTVVKHVANHGIGAAVASGFTMSVTGGNVSLASFAGSESGISVTLDPGAYGVAESAMTGYAMSQSSGCSGTLASNGTASCTVTNSDIPTGQGAITVIKNIINDNGGTLGKEAFTLKITPSDSAAIDVISGVAQFLAPNTYTVSEVDPTSLGYAQTGLSCTSGDATTNGVVTLAEQRAWVCTITNDDIAPKLTVTKVVINDNGGTKVVSDFPLFVDTTSVTSRAQITSTVGTHTVSETNQAGCAGTITGDCAADGSITLAAGDVKSCTITNDDRQTILTVIKHVVNDNNGTKSAGDFTLHVGLPGDVCLNVRGLQTSVPENMISNGNLTCSYRREAMLNRVINWLSPKIAFADIVELFSLHTFLGTETGTEIIINGATDYAVTENEDSGYTTTYSVGCSGSIALGEHKTCTITNNDVPPVPPSGGGGSSSFDYYGCTNPSAPNWNALANRDDNSCVIGGGNGGGMETPAAPQGEVLGAATTASEPELPLPVGCSAYITTYMKLGKKSNDVEDVKRLQTFLNEEMGATLPVSGFFGSMTKSWVKKFQKAHRTETIQPWIDAGHNMNGLMDGSGIVYKTTKRAINIAKCATVNEPMPDLTGDKGMTE